MNSKPRITIGRDILDMFDQYFPYGATLLDYLRRTRTDLRSLTYTFNPQDELSNKMTWLSIEVTNICNSNCIFCAHQYQHRFRSCSGFMSNNIFDKAIADFKKMGGTHVNLTPFSGEPLLDPTFIEKIEKIKKMGAWAGFFTNGIMLTRLDIEHLLQSGVDALTVSTAPLDQSMYTMLYRNNHYDNVLQGLNKLLIARNLTRSNFSIGITFRSHIPMRQVLALPDFQEFIAPLLTRQDWHQLIVNTRGFDTWGGQITSEDMVGIMRLALPPKIKYRPCSWTFNPYVMWNGQVRACACRFAGAQSKDGVDELYLGNIMESSLMEIWHGQAIRKLRRSFQDGNLPLVCRNCTMYKPC